MTSKSRQVDLLEENKDVNNLSARVWVLFILKVDNVAPIGSSRFYHVHVIIMIWRIDSTEK